MHTLVKIKLLSLHFSECNYMPLILKTNREAIMSFVKMGWDTEIRTLRYSVKNYLQNILSIFRPHH